MVHTVDEQISVPDANGQTPQRNIFVFGSNRQGRHGAGAARYAITHHGAQNGQAEGLQGNSYAIITKELRPTHPKVTLTEIKEGIQRFLEFAHTRPDLTFQLTPIGCGLAGYTPTEIAPLFTDTPDNVTLPPEFQ